MIRFDEIHTESVFLGAYLNLVYFSDKRLPFHHLYLRLHQEWSMKEQEYISQL
jgi:hypothetical protein